MISTGVQFDHHNPLEKPTEQGAGKG